VVGHRYLRSNPALGPDSGNNTILSSLYYGSAKTGPPGATFASRRATAKWKNSTTQFTATPQLDRRGTFRVRDSRIGPTDYGVA